MSETEEKTYSISRKDLGLLVGALGRDLKRFPKRSEQDLFVRFIYATRKDCYDKWMKKILEEESTDGH